MSGAPRLSVIVPFHRSLRFLERCLAAVTPLPPGSELIVEMVIAGQGVGMMSEWVAQPYRSKHDIDLVHVTATPERRTWWCATRRGELSEPVQGIVDLVLEHFDVEHTQH